MTLGLEPNTILSHCRIVSRIGAGGMGEVYLAQDTKLDCKVAFKPGMNGLTPNSKEHADSEDYRQLGS